MLFTQQEFLMGLRASLGGSGDAVAVLRQNFM